MRLSDFPAVAGLHHSGVVEQQINPAKVLEGDIAQALDLRQIANIRDASNRLRTARL
ncbi:hypothetical protein D3C71_2148600 [compost metagenome]